LLFKHNLESPDRIRFVLVNQYAFPQNKNFREKNI
jgi:hypothetical protein